MILISKSSGRFFKIFVDSYLLEQRHTVVVVIFDDVNHHHGEHRPEAKKDEETQERQENDDCSLWTSHNAVQCSGVSVYLYQLKIMIPLNRFS